MNEEINERRRNQYTLSKSDEETEAYKDGFKNGMRDFVTGERSSYSWNSLTDGGYTSRYSAGYRDGWVTAAKA